MFDVITIGTATQDIFLKSKYFKVIQDKNHLKKIGFPTGEAQCFALGGKIEIEEPIITTGGGATNSAVTFARQGLKTASLIKVGDDSAGKNILEELKRENIEPLIVTNGDKSTAYSVILLSPEGERTILVYRGASETLKIKDVPLEKFASRWAYISPGGIDFEIIEKIFDYLYKNNVLIAFNPSRPYLELGIDKLKALFGQSRVVLLNREEASFLTGIDYDKESEIFKKIDDITPGIAVMTDGSNGAFVSDGRQIYKSGVFNPKEIIDRTGAGDAFGSGFVAALIHKGESCDKNVCRSDNIEYAIRFGTVNADSVIRQIGAKAGILNKEEVENNKKWQKIEVSIV